MKNATIFFVLLLFHPFMFLSCSENENNTDEGSSGIYSPGKEINPFRGTYLLANVNDKTNKVELVENCWTKGLDIFEINAFGAESSGYYIAFDGFHATMYQMTNAELSGDTLLLTGEPEDEEESKPVNFKLFPIQDNAWKLVDGNNNYYYLVKQEDKENYPYIPCVEEIELTENLFQDEIIAVLFRLKNGNIDTDIPKEGILFETPGIGVAPLTDTLLTSQEVVATNLFNSSVYERLMEYVQMHNNEERSFITIDDHLPDRCAPNVEGLFIKFSNVENKDVPATAEALMVKRNDESGEVYTYFLMKFKFSDHIEISSIDNLDCGL